MVLFTVNTGLRESNACKLQWPWEVAVPEVGRSVFVIPPEAFKSKRAHVVILNDVAWSIVEAQRGADPIWVFPYRGKAVATMNNTPWQRARKEVGLPQVRVHDLRHVWATWHVMAGTTMAELQELGAWKSGLMVKRYAHFAPEQLRAAAAKLATFSSTVPENEASEATQGLE